MNKLIPAALILLALYQYANTQNGSKTPLNEPTPVYESINNTPVNKTSFKCDGRQHCSQMTSYDEAVFFLKNCPNTNMDGDRDGIPCERQFRDSLW